jgi:hypothetical protein
VSVNSANDCLTLRSNTVAGHVGFALMLVLGIGMLWGGNQFRLRGDGDWVLVALAGSVFALAGAMSLFSRPAVFCFDRTTGLLTVRGGTLVSKSEKCHRLSDIKAVTLGISHGHTATSRNVSLVMLPDDQQDGKESSMSLIWGVYFRHREAGEDACLLSWRWAGSR